MNKLMKLRQGLEKCLVEKDIYGYGQYMAMLEDEFSIYWHESGAAGELGADFDDAFDDWLEGIS